MDLVQEIGGPETPGIGFALSIERFIAALEAEELNLPIESRTLIVIIVSLGEEAKDYTVKLVHQLRAAGYSAERDYFDRKIKGQFKAADRLNAKYVAVLGEDELKENKINLKDMATGEQQQIELHEFSNKFTKIKDQ